ncbi:ATP-binding protein [Pseudomonas sp. RIT-PI-AD]|uniref:sensor histidine kinase n=1 Tax=Pseudomonas sp. RIT-PI-AD TaxID=3035294 RepID=UPI0021D86AB3|nr:ATP-binding protein [Pseudomonas sp. RIT-PI-AD]
MRSADTLFARLFGLSLLAIVLAHLLAFAWFSLYAKPHFPPPPPAFRGEWTQRPPPPPPPLGGPLLPLLLQSITLVIAAWYGARLLSRPIRRLSEAAERLSENLDSPALAEDGPMESRQAARAFNLMQTRIREQMQQRGRMLAAVSHDLRTPLARLKLRVEQVADDPLRERMARDLDEMVGMLDATLSYLHEQRASEAPQWFDLQALVESMAEDAQERGLDVQVEGRCAPLRAQPMALRSCLNNLLDNALRYGGDGVRIQLAERDAGIDVRVIDHGPGIPAAQREAVFEAFFRLEGSRNRNSGGVGLGLTITREAARRLGGDIRLEDTPCGGLTAVLCLPRS